MKPKLPDHIVDKIKRVNIVELVGVDRLTHKVRDEYEGPCPKCQGTDRFTVKPDGWFCRQCRPIDPKHGWHDALDYVMWMQGLSVSAAVEQLTGEKLRNNQMMQTKQTDPNYAPAPKEKQRSATWQADAQKKVDAAHTHLMEDETVGAEYLLGRGLQLDAWQAFGIGFTTHYNPDRKAEMPAICLPWVGRDGLMAVRYRFLAPGQGRKITALRDSQFQSVLFGRQALLGCAEKHRTLVLCEGEINAMSIWQAQHEAALDVLSLGSESAKLTPAMVDYANRFARVIVWMDKPEVVRELMAVIPGAYGVSSPKGKDANDLLRDGLLGGFLATVRSKAAQNEQEREKLYWDLSDMARMPGHEDAATIKTLERIKN